MGCQYLYNYNISYSIGQTNRVAFYKQVTASLKLARLEPIMLKSSPIILSSNSKNNHLLFFFCSHQVPNIPILFLWQVT